MNVIKTILRSTVIDSIRLGMCEKLKELQQKVTELNLQKAVKNKEHIDLCAAYEAQEVTLTLIDSSDGSTRTFASNRSETLKELDKIDNELREIEASLEMIESMKEEVQYEIMMIRRLSEKKVRI